MFLFGKASECPLVIKMGCFPERTNPQTLLLSTLPTPPVEEWLMTTDPRKTYICSMQNTLLEEISKVHVTRKGLKFPPKLVKKNTNYVNSFS